MKFHENNCHLFSDKNLPYKCYHSSCHTRFKTKKQRLIHHNFLNQECKSDRENLIQLLINFKKSTLNFVNNRKISQERLKKDFDLDKLQNIYEDVEKEAIDPDYFFYNLGENFNLPTK